MSRRFPPAVHKFISDHVTGTPVRELAKITTDQTGYSFTYSQMKSYLTNHNLTNGCIGGNKKGSASRTFPEEIRDYILNNYKGCSYQKMVELLMDTFGRKYSTRQICAFYSNHKLNSGLTGRFEKGHIPHNKGQKGIYVPGTEKGWFKPGSLPAGTKPIGYERINKDGYVEVKIKMRPSNKQCNDNFKLKQRLVWEKEHGPIKHGEVIIFKNGNKQDFRIENLMKISRTEHIEMCRRGFFTKNADLTESGAIIAKLVTTMRREKKERNKK